MGWWKTVWVVAGVLALAGCGSSDGGGTALAGIYMVTSHTENDAGCDVEGPTVTGDPYFVVATRPFFGSSVVALEFCQSVSECEGLANMSVSLSGALLVRGNDTDGRNGQVTSVFDRNGMCEGTDRLQILTGVPGMSAEYRVETRQMTLPLPTSGMCDVDDVRDAALTEPCGELELVRGTLVQSL